MSTQTRRWYVEKLTLASHTFLTDLQEQLDQLEPQNYEEYVAPAAKRAVTGFLKEGFSNAEAGQTSVKYLTAALAPQRKATGNAMLNDAADKLRGVYTQDTFDAVREDVIARAADAGIKVQNQKKMKR